ncbi:MAG: dipeptide epimerase [Armatimonadetes bacterium]|nr:dipeptide epimerase [Armatimonadota bacterium]
MPKIVRVSWDIVEIPQRVVFETARSKTSVSRAIIVKLKSDNGLIGRGEATPVEYVTGETEQTVQRDLAAMDEALRGQDVSAWRTVCATVRERLPESHTACAGLEIAAVDLFCQIHGLSMAQFFGGRKGSVVSDLTIPIVAPGLAFDLAREAAETYRHLKIKVGGPNRDEDLERVRQIHLGAPEAKLRIDANQGFEPEEAVEFVRKMNALGVSPEIVEQPVQKADIEGLRYVKENVPEPVLADEAAVNPRSVLKLLKLEAVDGVNIKLMKAGFTGALDIISMCQAAGKKLMIGCMLESPVGIGAGVHIACGTGAFDYLDLDGDVLGEPTGMEQNYTRSGETLSV